MPHNVPCAKSIPKPLGDEMESTVISRTSSATVTSSEARSLKTRFLSAKDLWRIEMTWRKIPHAGAAISQE